MPETKKMLKVKVLCHFNIYFLGGVGMCHGGSDFYPLFVCFSLSFLQSLSSLGHLESVSPIITDHAFALMRKHWICTMKI